MSKEIGRSPHRGFLGNRALGNVGLGMTDGSTNTGDTGTLDDVADLDELVRELNQPERSSVAPGATGHGDETEQRTDSPQVKSPTSDSLHSGPGSIVIIDRARFELTEGLRSLLQRVIARGGSDVHLVDGVCPFIRIDGDLEPLDAEPVSEARMESWIEQALTDDQRRRLDRDGAVDFSVHLASDSQSQALGRTPSAARFRVNVHRQRGKLAASLRALPTEVPNFEELGLPVELRDLVRPLQGVVLVCGPTGAGKSTTLAALVDWINRERRAHVLTLEDPIEYEHRNRRSLIQQMEVGIDIPDFAQGLRSALRQDPDVILLGEMRDLESIGTALAAAETGHLLLSTVHTSDPAQAIHRVVDVFPAEAREQIRQLLAAGLEAIVCQRLLPRIGGGRVLAVEILKATNAVRHHIRSGGLHKLYNEMVTGQRHGMVTMESALAQLVGSGLVTREDALARSTRPDEIESLLRHLG